MLFRPTAYVCCLLIATGPAVALAPVIAHAQHHEEALITGHGHHHDHGDIPHHEHDDDGAPIPADGPVVVIRPAQAPCARAILEFTQPAPFASSVVAAAQWRPAIVGPLAFDEPVPLPHVPAPGDILPLLI